ncbi:SDR family oxidoreductase [Candidatus Bathyarchaeota archaeon A05DMB-2]|jgi:3-oxoacyl-[acyl-carrier protein] reductase|nr:SDR family oxidoreductase [Candidatus Bathyarchaeota archaeon A05DMB-2]
MLRPQSKKLRPLADLISLSGKIALITGAASGIGKAMAYRFAEAGATLELVDINEEQLKITCDELSKSGVRIGTHKVDLCEKSEIEQLWSELVGKEPDILVNNAGIYPMKDFLELDEAFLRKVMDLNLNAALWMCQNMIKARMKRGGVIINVASVEAVMPVKEDLVPYGLSKVGVIMLTRSLAAEYGRKGFRINALVPGGVLTPGTKNVAKEVLKLNVGIIQTGLEYRQRLPLGRLGEPDEIARMALVLASDLSSYVHGTLVAVDGGFLSA